MEGKFLADNMLFLIKEGSMSIKTGAKKEIIANESDIVIFKTDTIVYSEKISKTPLELTVIHFTSKTDDER